MSKQASKQASKQLGVATGSFALALIGAACVGDERVAVTEQAVVGGTDDIVIVQPPAPGDAFVANDIRQWARDATAVVFPGCSGTLVSPRVIATAAHCLDSRGGGVTSVGFSPLVPGGPAPPATPAIRPPVSIPVADCFPNARTGMSRTGGCSQACPFATPTTCFDVPATGNDIALLVLAERVDVGRSGRRLSEYPVVPAHLQETAAPDPSPWADTHDVSLVGYGSTALIAWDTTTPALRQTVSVTIEDCTGTTCTIRDANGRRGDSGGSLYLPPPPPADPTAVTGPRTLLGVFTSGGDLFTRVEHSQIQTEVIMPIMGAPSAHYPGAMVSVSTVGAVHPSTLPAGSTTLVWTGDVDCPPTEEGADARSAFVDSTGHTADQIDPDGDGLAGSHDLCWGIHDPLQRLSDPTTLVFSSSFCARRGIPNPGCLVPVGTTELSLDRDNDGVPNPCDNCPDNFNPSQYQCDPPAMGGSGPNAFGDACAPDGDHDGIPDVCDPCPTVATLFTRNCNDDAELVVLGSGLSAASYPSDVCDPTPCGFTRIESATSGTSAVLDRLRVDATVAGGAAEFHSGFRFCPCSLASDGSPGSIDACTGPIGDGSGGCAIAMPSVFASTLTTERRDYRIVTLDQDTRLDSTFGIDLTHDLSFDVDLDAHWSLETVDLPRWWGAFPTSYPTRAVGGVPVLGVFWTQTLAHAPAGAPLAGMELALAAHYTGGPVGGIIPAVALTPGAPGFTPIDPIIPLPADSGFCAFCGDPFPVPWVSFRCRGHIGCESPDATTPLIALRDAVVTPRLSASWIDPPGFELFGGLAGARWVAAAEPASASPTGALRFAALAADHGLPSRLLSLGGAGLEPFAKTSCGKTGCFTTQVSISVVLAAGPVASAADAGKPSRTGFAAALSAVENTLWIAGGVDAAGNELHDVFAFYAVDQTGTRVSTRPLVLGHVAALAWNAADRRLYALDEVSDEVSDTHRATFTRLISIAPDGSGGREEMRWRHGSGDREEMDRRHESGDREEMDRRHESGDDEDMHGRHTTPNDVFVLAFDQFGHAWLGVSRDEIPNHTVGRLTRAPGGSWTLDGFVNGAGSVHRDGAYANDRGLSVAIVEDPRTRIVGYAASDLHPHSGLEPWL